MSSLKRCLLPNIQLYFYSKFMALFLNMHIFNAYIISLV